MSELFRGPSSEVVASNQKIAEDAAIQMVDDDESNFELILEQSVIDLDVNYPFDPAVISWLNDVNTKY